MKQNTPPLVLRSEMRTDSVPVDEPITAPRDIFMITPF